MFIKSLTSCVPSRVPTPVPGAVYAKMNTKGPCPSAGCDLIEGPDEYVNRPAQVPTLWASSLWREQCGAVEKNEVSFTPWYVPGLGQERALRESASMCSRGSWGKAFLRELSYVSYGGGEGDGGTLGTAEFSGTASMWHHAGGHSSHQSW